MEAAAVEPHIQQPVLIRGRFRRRVIEQVFVDPILHFQPNLDLEEALLAEVEPLNAVQVYARKGIDELLVRVMPEDDTVALVEKELG